MQELRPWTTVGRGRGAGQSTGAPRAECIAERLDAQAGQKWLKTAFGQLHTYLAAQGWLFAPSVKWPHLHDLVMRAPPVVKAAVAEPAVYSVNALAATGTSLLLAGIVSALVLRMGPLDILRTYLSTLKRVRFSLLTIAAMLALGFTRDATPSPTCCSSPSPRTGRRRTAS